MLLLSGEEATIEEGRGGNMTPEPPIAVEGSTDFHLASDVPLSYV